MNESAGQDPLAGQSGIHSRSGWYAVIVLLIALLFSFTDRFIINLVVDPIRAELSLTDIQISVLQGIGFTVIFALAGLPFGWLADRVNRRKLIASGIVLWSAATIACGLATGFWSFLAARAAVGAGEAALIPAATSLIIDMFPARRRGTALGIFSLGATFGIGTAYFIGGLLLRFIEGGHFDSAPFFGGLSSWRKLMILGGLPGFLLVIFVLTIPEPARHHSSGLLPLAEVKQRLLAHNWTVLRVALVKAIVAIGDYGLIAWLPTLLQRAFGLSAPEAGGILALSITTAGAIALLSGGAGSDWFARRWGTQSRVVLLLGCYALTIFGAVALFLADTPQIIGLVLAIWAFGSVGGYVIGHLVMQESVPNEMRATTIALSLTLTALIGIGLGPTLVPIVAEHVYRSESALQPAMATTALGAALVAFLLIWPPIRRGFAEIRANAAGVPPA
jgi:MFS family permease